MSKASDAEQLMREGYQLIEEGDFDSALKVGQKLLDLRHTSGFEILALAHAGKDELKQAIEVLQKGVAKAPSVWLLWQLLGNYQSDARQFPAAHDAYERALNCPHVNVDSVTLNRAIAKEREGLLDDALALLDVVSDDDAKLHARAIAEKLDVLIAQGNGTEAARLGSIELDRIDREVDDEVLAMLMAATAKGIWLGEHDRERALAIALDALRIRRGCKDALWLIREIRGQRCPTAKYLRLLVSGSNFRRDDGDETFSFYSSYDAVADSPEQALEFIKETESDAIAETLTVEECSEIEARPDDPIGVYRTSGLACYSDEQPE